ncbi:MAG: hypothetical protein IH623_00300 [Verrucomicrobia bacterium]|nr:hypothetical protein [Verrucomicrobiota bacterium]
MGDFSIPTRTSPLFQAITKYGLEIPKALLGAHGTNLAKDKRYDQILHYAICPDNFANADGELDFCGAEATSPWPGKTPGCRNCQVKSRV